MKETEKIIDNDLSDNEESKTTQKNWKKPELKILPIPSKTQGGPLKGPTETPTYGPS